MVTGATRRAQEGERAWASHQSASEAWEADRERLRAGAFREAHDEALRKGRGAPAAAADGHLAARQAVGDFERRVSPPEFGGKETSTRWLAQTTQKIKEAVL